MIEALKDLHGLTNLVTFKNESDSAVLRAISEKYDVKAVAFNRDVTPFARRRDTVIYEWCKANNIKCIQAEDYTLHPVDQIKNLGGTYYKVLHI